MKEKTNNEEIKVELGLSVVEPVEGRTLDETEDND